MPETLQKTSPVKEDYIKIGAIGVNSVLLFGFFGNLFLYSFFLPVGWLTEHAIIMMVPLCLYLSVLIIAIKENHRWLAGYLILFMATISLINDIRWILLRRYDVLLLSCWVVGWLVINLLAVIRMPNNSANDARPKMSEA